MTISASFRQFGMRLNFKKGKQYLMEEPMEDQSDNTMEQGGNMLLAKLGAIALERSQNIQANDLKIRGLWNVDYLYRPNLAERNLSYSMLFVQTLQQGCCYCSFGKERIDQTWLHKDARDLIGVGGAMEIAALDAIFACFNRHPVLKICFSGTSEEKAVYRAEIVASEVIRISPKKPRVLNVGVMGNFFDLLKKHGAVMVGADFAGEVDSDPRYEESYLERAEETLKKVPDCDVVLATGMTLYTGTLDDLLVAVKQRGKKLVLFAATGAHFGEVYCKNFGVDIVICEPQPQYMFSGTSVIEIQRRTENGSDYSGSRRGK